jgi:hypothetical protein
MDTSLNALLSTSNPVTRSLLVAELEALRDILPNMDTDHDSELVPSN